MEKVVFCGREAYRAVMCATYRTLRRLVTPLDRSYDADWTTKLWQSVVNVLIVLAFVVVYSILFVVLYVCRCYKVRLTLNLLHHCYQSLNRLPPL